MQQACLKVHPGPISALSGYDSLCAHGLLQVQEAAGRLAARMRQEPSGTQAAVDAFHRYKRSRCTVTQAAHNVRPACLMSVRSTLSWVSATSVKRLPSLCKAAGFA